MEPEQNPRIIEELKAAGEELREEELAELTQKEKKSQPFEKEAKQPLNQNKFGTGQAALTSKVKEGGIDLFGKIKEYQKELSQEQSVLEKSHHQVRELEKKLEGRMEALKRLQQKRAQIDKDLKEFQEGFKNFKKENNILLNQIKSSLREHEAKHE